jgi:hypothetical protein
LLELGHEAHGIEFKPSGPLERATYGTDLIIRAMLGMANRRDGGTIVVGVAEVDGRPDPQGVDPAHLASWNHDHLSALINACADPYVRFRLGPPVLLGERPFVVIEVEEFDQLPVICTRNATDANRRPILQVSAIYVRTRRKPETTQVPSQTEMRELLTLATEKGVRVFVSTAQGAGLRIVGGPAVAERFAEQLRDFGG